MRRLFWLLVGAGLAVFLLLRGRQLLERFTPKGVVEQVEKKGHETAAGFGEFMATFRTSMAQREAELRDELNIPANNN
ncbi:hypothetical protein SAMN02745244_03394 [Tessaracoccus bendigoensis DSM 12906]|uniref:Uncharacterized protein n=1 Tax=Tessaracoccus bendigoensis DSM 12906 TaxID=1123357 RepID=A0A1M6MLZ7_9ACTN|nr:DUF6167 family protein [Tessaracoccus bendigoensis]SHJ84400.1 hypothetical protein SAMN02745244_03394 [Tessaracoccus bendigoensis DSM 12906]